MDAFLQDIIRWLPSGWIYYLAIGLISFFESLAVAGIFMPGSVLIVFAGFLAANGKGLFLPLFMAATAGAIIGDVLSYWLGARMGESLVRRPMFRKRAALLHKARIFFADHGGKSVFIGRFVGFLRPFIPFIAGSARMRPAPFFFYVVLSGLLWGLVYPGLGYVFGTSWKLVQVWTGRFSLLIGALVVIFILNALLWRWLAPRIFNLCSRLGRLILCAWQVFLDTDGMESFTARHPRAWAFIVNRFRPGHGSGLYLSLGLLFSILFALSFLWISTSLEGSSTVSQVDRRIYEMMPLASHTFSDTLFLLLTCLGDWQVLLIFGALACGWLLLHGWGFRALILAAGTASGHLFVVILKTIYSRPRPEAFFTSVSAQSWAFPSAHAFIAAVFYGLIVYMCLDAASRWRERLALIIGGSFLVLLIGLSRIYLGVHWFSDVLGGFALAALWLSFLITGCEMYRRYDDTATRGEPGQPTRLPKRCRTVLLALAVTAAAGSSGAYMSQRLQQGLASQAPPPPAKTLAAVSPERMLVELPTHTENLTGDKLRPLSMIVFSSRSDLGDALKQAGWRRARELTSASFRDRFLNIERGESQLIAPVMPLLVAGNGPDRAFVRPDPRKKLPARLTALVWDLGYRLPDGRRARAIVVSRCIGLQSILSIALPLPVIAPDVDLQRDDLVRDLARYGNVERFEQSEGEPKEGSDSIGNPFRTDGRIFLLWLQSRR